MLTRGQVLMAPTGTRMGSGGWDEIGYVANDGIVFDETVEYDSALSHRANPPIAHGFTVRFAGKKSHRRAVAKLFTGRHRLPGDRPLIHNGRKP